WPSHGGVAARRHWHTACCNARDRRPPGVRRSRNAPKF
ncbi:ATP/GTP-binding protein, partial [Streptomyces sp. NPDC060002]